MVRRGAGPATRREKLLVGETFPGTCAEQVPEFTGVISRSLLGCEWGDWCCCVPKAGWTRGAGVRKFSHARGAPVGRPSVSGPVTAWSRAAKCRWAGPGGGSSRVRSCSGLCSGTLVCSLSERSVSGRRMERFRGVGALAVRRYRRARMGCPRAGLAARAGARISRGRRCAARGRRVYPRDPLRARSSCPHVWSQSIQSSGCARCDPRS